MTPPLAVPLLPAARLTVTAALRAAPVLASTCSDRKAGPVPLLAPAVANALAVLSGKRLRKLPLRGLSGIVRDLSAGA